MTHTIVKKLFSKQPADQTLTSLTEIESFVACYNTTNSRTADGYAVHFPGGLHLYQMICYARL